MTNPKGQRPEKGCRMLRTKLENGDVVKTVDIDGKEVSSVDGNVLTVQKWGKRKGEEDGETREATASRTIITREDIDAAVEAQPVIGGFGTEEILLQFNQVQREDAVNSANAEIRGDGSSPEMGKAKKLAKLMEQMSLSEAKDYVELAEAGDFGDALEEVLGAERLAEIRTA